MTWKPNWVQQQPSSLLCFSVAKHLWQEQNSLWQLIRCQVPSPQCPAALKPSVELAWPSLARLCKADTGPALQAISAPSSQAVSKSDSTTINWPSYKPKKSIKAGVIQDWISCKGKTANKLIWCKSSSSRRRRTKLWQSLLQKSPIKSDINDRLNVFIMWRTWIWFWTTTAMNWCSHDPHR